MKLYTKIKIELLRLGFQLRTKSRYYQYWSHLYRLLFNPASKCSALADYTSYAQLAKVLSTLQWKPDGWKELWDACADPEFVQYVIDAGGDRAIGDCDEFAIYIVGCLNKAIQQGTFADKTLESVAFMTVTWVDQLTGQAGGHNVALLMGQHEDGGAVYAYMDYGIPSTPRPSIIDVVEDVMSEYAPGGTCCGYAVQAQDLTPFIVEWGDDVLAA